MWSHTADLSYPAGGQSETNAQTVPHPILHPPWSRYYAHSPLLFFLLKAALADSKYQGRYWVVPLVATSCIFSAE